MSQVFVVSCLLVNVFARAAPVVDLKLAPAAAALPDIISQIAGLEGARVDEEEASLARLDAAYEAGRTWREVWLHGEKVTTASHCRSLFTRFTATSHL